MYRDPKGTLYETIPQRWLDGEFVRELAGDFRRAKRVGWIEIIQSNEEKASSENAKMMAKAGEITQQTGCLESIGRIIDRITAIKDSGIDVTNWTFASIIDALKEKCGLASLEEKITLLHLVQPLPTEWLAIVAYCDGDFNLADNVWDSLCDVYFASKS